MDTCRPEDDPDLHSVGTGGPRDNKSSKALHRCFGRFLVLPDLRHGHGVCFHACDGPARGMRRANTTMLISKAYPVFDPLLESSFVCDLPILIRAGVDDAMSGAIADFSVDWLALHVFRFAFCFFKCAVDQILSPTSRYRDAIPSHCFSCSSRSIFCVCNLYCRCCGDFDACLHRDCAPREIPLSVLQGSLGVRKAREARAEEKAPAADEGAVLRCSRCRLTATATRQKPPRLVAVTVASYQSRTALLVTRSMAIPKRARYMYAQATWTFLVTLPHPLDGCYWNVLPVGHAFAAPERLCCVRPAAVVASSSELTAKRSTTQEMERKWVGGIRITYEARSRCSGPSDAVAEASSLGQPSEPGGPWWTARGQAADPSEKNPSGSARPPQKKSQICMTTAYACLLWLAIAAGTVTQPP